MILISKRHWWISHCVRLYKIRACVMTHYWNLYLMVDAGPTGLGLLLMQKSDDRWKPTVCASRRLTETEQRYSQLERATSDENRYMPDVSASDRFQSEVSTLQNQRFRLLFKTRDTTVSERQTLCFIQRSHSATSSAPYQEQYR